MWEKLSHLESSSNESNVDGFVVSTRLDYSQPDLAPWVLESLILVSHGYVNVITSG